MSNNNGCLSVLLAMLVALVFAAIALGGAPNVAGLGLSWDSSASIARTNARVEMNYQDNLTERIQSRNNSIVAQRWAEVFGIVGVVLALAWSVQRGVVAWAARPHRPQAPPPQIVMMAAPTLQAEPAARLEWSRDDQAWVIVNDRTQTIRLLEDSQRRG